MNIYKKLGLGALAVTLGLGATSCKKSYLDTKPSNQVQLDDVFKTVDGAKTVVHGITRLFYANVTDHDEFGLPAINMYHDLMGEDFGINGQNWFYDAANYSKARNGTSYTWNFYYQVINNTNYILKYIDQATGSETDRNEVKGQALALRGWAYLQLIQTYQFPYGGAEYICDPGGGATSGVPVAGASTTQALGVPVYTEPTKTPVGRGSMKEVLDRLNSDLDSSIYYFEQGTGARSDKSQININVAYGIHARAALYQRLWTKAAASAQKAREGYQLATGNGLLDGFNKVSAPEWIWGLEINQEQNSIYASFASHMDIRISPYAMTAQKIASAGFYRANVDIPFRILDTTDIRRKWWVPYSGSIAEYSAEGYIRRSQLKFKAQNASSFLTDYPLMRVAEMYLVEAEALAMANDLTGAKAVLEEFAITRDPDFLNSPTLTLATKNDVVQEIWRQRRIELWGEGFRLFDAKRQMVASTGVTPLIAINRGASGFLGRVYSSKMLISAYAADLNFRIPSNERLQNPAVINNP